MAREPTEADGAGEDVADGGGEAAASAAANTATGPQVRVHEQRLERGVSRMELSPTEALRLASQGPAGLSRRELPPDTSGGSEDV